MNVITRGMRNALRSPMRSGAVLLMLAISTGLVLAMLAARASVEAKINEVKATTATQVTITPAGIRGGMGGGDPLTADQLNKIKQTSHISSTAATLTDQLGSEDTNLTPSFELGSFGKRQLRFESKGGEGMTISPEGNANAKAPTPRTNITGTTNPGSITASKPLTSGELIDGNSSEYVALLGKTLAEKNNLSVGSTFTIYGKTFTVKGIYSTENAFEDSGLIVPLATLQTLTEQPGAVTGVTATVDSSDNVASTVSALKTALGNKADITSQQEQAENSLKPLESIASLALSGVIGAATAGAAIILLSMIMIVRERRREIGVIKAIGGTNAKVITQFITEALTLTIIGGIIGMGLGIAVSGPMTQSLASSASNSQMGPRIGEGSGFQAIKGGLGGVATQLGANTKDITASVSPQTFAMSAGIILLIAIVGSAVPAWAIARIRPAEVLRTE
jgi:putative ABC transport system permease protein